jgi:hypothetical protein
MTLDKSGDQALSSDVAWNPDPATFVALDDFYLKDKNNVYEIGFQSQIPVRIAFADAQTFTLIPSATSSNTGLLPLAEWAKDKNYVYDYAYVLPDANPATFKLLSPEGDYATDGKELFFNTDSQSYADNYADYTVQKDFDPSTFQPLENGYAKDKNHIFFQGEILNGIDPATVNFMDRVNCQTDPSNSECTQGYSYVKDATQVVLVDEYDWQDSGMVSQRVQGADPATFILVPNNPNYDAEDKNHKYLDGKVVQ